MTSNRIAKLIKTGHQRYGDDKWYVFTDTMNAGPARECTAKEAALLTALVELEREEEAA